MPGKLVPFLMAVLIGLTMLIGEPKIAWSSVFSYQIDLKAGGRIDIDREIGSLAESSAVKTQQIRGEGEIIKHETMRFAMGAMAIDEYIEWSTFEDALRNLTVTTRIDLCAPGVSAATNNYSSDDYDIARGDLISPYHPLVRSGDVGAASKTDQTWFVSISASPAHSAYLRSEFESACTSNVYFDRDDVPEGASKVSGWYAQSDSTWPGRDVFHHGSEFRGIYFDMMHHAYVSDGLTRRYTSMSSPFSTAIMEQSFEVAGMTEMWEEFNMMGLPAGRDATPVKWWNLF